MTTNKVQVDNSTAGTSTSTTYTVNSKPPTEYGWVCPRCNRVNAPWKSSCDCAGYGWTWDWWKTPNDEWWKHVYCDSDTFKVHPETTTWKAPSSVCHSDSATVTQSSPNSTVYTTAYNDVVGGSDYWNPSTNTWENVSKSISNMKQELDEIKNTFNNTLRGE